MLLAVPSVVRDMKCRVSGLEFARGLEGRYHGAILGITRRLPNVAEENHHDFL
jgi:hypothetical protein